MNLSSISKPTLLLDKKQCQANIDSMAFKASKHNVLLKPHMKTHQSAKIGDWLQQSGVKAITVSSVDMAEYFANHNWKDITIAFPINIREISRINRLAEKITLTLLVVSEKSIRLLSQELNHPVNIYIELDTGSNRTGLKTDQLKEIYTLYNSINDAPELNFRGFYSHPGHSYNSRSKGEIRKVHKSVLDQIEYLRENFQASQSNYSICIGDTPCCSTGQSFEGIDHISPGNFAFYDLMQTRIGSCNLDHIAVALAAPVVAKFPKRRQIVVHGGAVHLSKDSMNFNGDTIFGMVSPLSRKGWSEPYPSTFVTALSQEHGIIQCSQDSFSEIQEGDLLAVLPVHSCLTADCMRKFKTLRGTSITMMPRP